MNSKLLSLTATMLLLVSPVLTQADSETDDVEADQIPALQNDSGMEPENYGIADWVVKWIPASAFVRRDGGAPMQYAGTGGIFSDSGSATVWAPLQIPNGALVDTIRMFVCDNDDGNFRTLLTVYSGTTTPGFNNIDTVDSVGTPGCTTYAMEDMNHTIDIGPTSNNSNYNIVATIPESSATSSFRGVKVAYHLQISPAPTVATFADVPTGHWAFAHIEALAASGITGGCGGTNYCPENNVTRAQMAVFLAKALGLHYGW